MMRNYVVRGELEKKGMRSTMSTVWESDVGYPSMTMQDLTLISDSRDKRQRQIKAL
jgi:hypothetical protein